MSLGIILDVAIGLVFTYLLLAILVSGVQEMVAGWLSLRGKGLRDGLEALLAGLGKSGQPHPVLFETVFGHALVSKLARNGLPSYVPARNFSLALFDALKDGSNGPLFSRIEQGVAMLPNGPAKQSLTAFITEAAGDVDAFQKRVESWFDDAMDRLSGEYKRFSQIFTLVAALVVAMVLNVDSISLARTLWTEPTIRAAFVGAAERYKSANPDGPAMDFKKACESLVDLPMPIGWKGGPVDKKACEDARPTFDISPGKIWDRLGTASGLWILLGWIITALAVSFGAPFWFSALEQLLKLRNTGPKPPRSDAAAQGARQ
jgi:hypothetical protein